MPKLQDVLTRALHPGQTPITSKRRPLSCGVITKSASRTAYSLIWYFTDRWCSTRSDNIGPFIDGEPEEPGVPAESGADHVDRLRKVGGGCGEVLGADDTREHRFLAV